jgi:hypothetical protein
MDFPRIADGPHPSHVALPLRLDAKLRDQRIFVRELVRLEFGIDDFAIHAYIEDAASAPNQSWLDAECAFELGSQTAKLAASGR